MVTNLIAAFIGLVVGLIAGWTLTWVFTDWFYKRTPQIIGGTIVGLVFGGLIGSITADANKTSGSTNHALVIAGFFGIIGGICGATKMDVIRELLTKMNFQPPF